MLKDVKLNENFDPLLISMPKSKILSSIFTLINLNFNADFQKFNAEILITPSYLELCGKVIMKGAGMKLRYVESLAEFCVLWDSKPSPSHLKLVYPKLGAIKRTRL